MILAEIYIFQFLYLNFMINSIDRFLCMHFIARMLSINSFVRLLKLLGNSSSYREIFSKLILHRAESVAVYEVSSEKNL